MLHLLRDLAVRLTTLLDRHGLALALVAAFLTRVAVGVYLGFDAPPDLDAGGADYVEYEAMAWSWAQGEGLRDPEGKLTAFRAPGYPLALGSLYRLFGRHFWLNRLLNIALGVASCALVFLVGRRLTGSRPVAAVAAMIVALLPLQFYYTAHFSVEPLLALLGPATVWLLLLASDARASRAGLAWLAAGGFVNGLAILVRPTALLMVPALFLLVWMSRRFSLREALVVGAVFGVASLVPTAPAVYRNYLVFDRFVLVASNGGSTFWGGNNEIVAEPGSREWGDWVTTNSFPEVKDREVRILDNQIDRDRAEYRLGLRFLRENPEKMPLLLIGKFVRLINPIPDTPNRIFNLVVGLSETLLLPLYLVGIFLVGRRPDLRQRFLPVWAQGLALVGVTAIFYGNVRFRAGFEPFLAIFAAIALVRLMGRLSSSP